MKASLPHGAVLIGLVGALALGGSPGAPANAKLASYQPRPMALSNDEVAIYTGADGAMLEHNYFIAPPSTVAGGRPLPCRRPLHLFDKTELAQSCN